MRQPDFTGIGIGQIVVRKIHLREKIMSFNYKSLLPTPAQIKAEFPLTPECVELKAARDKEVADVITG